MNDLLSLLALVLSGVALWHSFRQSKKSDRLTEQEIELVRQQLASNRRVNLLEREANVSARMFKEGKSWKIRVFNTGPSDARNIRIQIEESNQLVVEGAFEGKFPLARMEKGQSVDFWANVHKASPLKETLTILWDDQAGRDRKNNVELTV
jgi:hypothetical protein